MPHGSITIDINKKTDRFFIAIAKTDVHSFVFFGVYNQFKVNNLLSRVGKVFYSKEKDEYCWDELVRVFQLLFSGLRAQLMDEGIFRRGRSQGAINYQAYDIHYEQYLEYLAILSNLSTEDNVFRCYLPHEESDEQITLKFGIVSPEIRSHVNAGKIQVSVANLDTGNTCRHSAIELLETVRKEPVTASVSKYFFFDLPYKTEFEYGHPSDSVPFYVLPMPPSVYVGLGDMKENILKKLYARMERIPRIAPKSQATMNKFSQLKELYTDIAGAEQDLSLQQLLTHIQSWKNSHLDLLDSLREKYIWDFFFKRTSATMSLINEIESELSSMISMDVCT